MAGRCNLFRKLDNENGQFFMFSQYAEDLTKSYGNTGYNVRPTEFICMDLKKPTGTPQDAGIYFSEILQNGFENSCSLARYKLGNTWNPQMSLDSLFTTLLDYEFITTTLEQNPVVEEIKYIGKINISSYNELEGVGYHETYCFIPNNARQQSYIIRYDGDQFIEYLHENDDPNEPYLTNILGFEGATDPDNAPSYVVTNYLHEDGSHNKGYYYNHYDYDFGNDWSDDNQPPTQSDSNNDSLVASESPNTDNFTFNAVLLLYSISDSEGNYIKKHIPMGLYVTGVPTTDDQEHYLTNYVTKYSNNEEIYNQGTSYGLRVCTRFLVSTNTLEPMADITATQYDDENALKYYQLMCAIARSQSLMEDICDTAQDMTLALKSHLAMFRNYRVNVPYIREVNGEQHWFVNGRDLGVVLPPNENNE